MNTLQENMELVDIMCNRAVKRMMDNGNYALAYREAVNGIRKGVTIPDYIISELRAIVE